MSNIMISDMAFMTMESDYRQHFWYHKIAAKSECVLHMGQTKKEGNIWHVIFGIFIIGLSKTCHYYQNVWLFVIEWNVKWGHAKNDLRIHIKGKQLQQTHSFNYF